MRRPGRVRVASREQAAVGGSAAAEPSVVQPSPRRRHREPAADGEPEPAAGVDGAPEPTVSVDEEPKRTKVPLYPRLLRLQHVHPNAWQRAALGEGALGAAVLLVLADLATAWTLVVLPVAVAVVVKAHDGLAGILERAAPPPPRDPAT
ncbi:MAG: hypothetical protein JWN08_2113 [Frankiales bacterium]|nr:hypothetical protein [Frankiales bacterium]